MNLWSYSGGEIGLTLDVREAIGVFLCSRARSGNIPACVQPHLQINHRCKPKQVGQDIEPLQVDYRI